MTDWQTGDLNAFAALVEERQADVLAVALATVLDRALAEDVAQETFIAAYERRAQLRDPSALGGWLAAIARNIGRDLLRKRKRERLVEPSTIEIADENHTHERAALCRDVQRVVGRVPARYREVLLLYYSYERSVTSIAQSLGLSEAATMQRLSRGRQMIRDTGAFADLSTKPRRSFTVAVLALLALRQSARAAPRRVPLRQRAVWAVGLAAVLGIVRSDASGERPTTSAPNLVAEPPAPIVTTIDTPRIEAAALEPRLASTAITLSRPALPPRVPPTRTATLEPALEVAAYEGEIPECVSGCPVQPPSMKPPRPPLPYDQVNGLLETAAMPRARDVSYETIGTAMIVRAGLTRHVAVHVGMIPMDTDRGTTGANANPAFGGGLKIGGQVTKYGRIAVLGEYAREVNLKTAETNEGYWGRAYAAVTLGTPHQNVTLVGGVVSEFDGTNRWRSPMVGVSSNLAWDDNLGFILESQHFTTPRGTLDGMSVLAVRFRDHAPAKNFLGVDRVRIDVGVALLDRTSDEVDGLPWLQVGFGW